MKWNKSTTYMLPFVCRDSDRITNFASDGDFPTNLYFNSYVFHSKDNFKFPCILLVYKYVQNSIFEVFENKYLISNPNFIEKRKETDFLISFLFKIPDMYLDNYTKFLEGKYSRIEESSKARIIRFFNLIKYENESKNTDIVNVLYRSDVLKKKIEKKLDIELPFGAELSSSINFEDETFMLEKYSNEQMV